MKPLPIKKTIFKSLSLPIKEFDNFINIIIVPYVIILPLHLYVTYYDDFILRLFIPFRLFSNSVDIDFND